VQKEAFYFEKPCVILRPETEWVELVKNGTAELVDADPEKLRNGFRKFTDDGKELEYPAFYGNGKTAEFILNEIIMMFEKP